MITITDGHATLDIAPEAGGAIAAYRWHAREKFVDWLRPAGASAIARNDAGEMACFPLVPYSNRVRNAHFAFEDVEVQLPQTSPDDPHFEHGHGWRANWTIAEHNSDRAVLRYRHRADAWPWDYEAEQVIALSNGELSISISVQNLAQTPMPAGIGLHPYFPAAARTRLTAQVDAMWETDAEILPTRLITPPARVDPSTGFDIARAQLDTVFTGWSRHAHVAWPEQARTLDIKAEGPLDYLVLYTPKGEPYFCAEPVSNITDAFNLAGSGVPNTGLRILDPGETLSGRVHFVPHITSA